MRYIITIDVHDDDNMTFYKQLSIKTALFIHTKVALADILPRCNTILHVAIEENSSDILHLDH